MKKHLKFSVLALAIIIALTTFSIDLSYAQYDYGETGGGSQEYGQSYSYQKECRREVHTSTSCTTHFGIGWTYTTVGTTIICIYTKDATGCYGGGVLQNPPRCTSYNPC